ncbi:MAG: adenylate/guanylate cyclase domain-containing protein [Polyangia bacterium]|jgi:adenylate cyclase
MGTMFLQEVEATVVVADVRDFSPLAAQLGPVELGLALSRFYEHVGAAVERHRGRIVKFIGDGVLAVFIGAPEVHRERALLAIAELVGSRQAFLDENVGLKLPVLDYAIGAASGHLLAGELGTDKLRFYDVLGQPVNQAFRLTGLATRRGVTNLIAADTYEQAAKDHRPTAVETDMVELGSDKLRLFKVEGP